MSEDDGPDSTRTFEESPQHHDIRGHKELVSRGLKRRCMGGGKLVASGEAWHHLGPECSAIS